MAQDNHQFQFLISAIDQATGPMLKIAKTMEGLGAPIRRLAQRLSEIREHSGITRLAEGLNKIREHIFEMGKEALSAFAPVGALVGLASAAGIVEAAASFTTFSHQLTVLGNRTKLTTLDLQALMIAAEDAGVAPETLDKAFNKLNLTLSRAKQRDPKAMSLFRYLGIDIKDEATGGVKDAAQIWQPFFKALQRAKDDPSRKAMLQFAMGKGGPQFESMTKELAENFEYYQEEVRKHGGLTDEQKREGQELWKVQKDLGHAVHGLEMAIGAGLAPAMKKATEAMTEWVDANRAWLSTKISEAFDTLSNAAKEVWGMLKQVDWVKFAHETWDALKAITAVANDIIGLKGSLILLATAMVGGPLLVAISTLALAFGVLSGAMLLPIAGFVAGMGLVIAAIEGVKAIWNDWESIKQAGKDAGTIEMGEIDDYGNERSPTELAELKAARRRAAAKLVPPVMPENLRGTAIADSTTIPSWMLPRNMHGRRATEEGYATDFQLQHAAGMPQLYPLPAMMGGRRATEEGVKASVDVSVTFDNVPPGTLVNSSASGDHGLRTRVRQDVGYSYPTGFTYSGGQTP